MQVKVSPQTFVVSVCFSLLALTVAHGQTSTATLSGTVTDPSEGNIPGAIVRAESPVTGLKREVRTDESGHYSINFLPIGEYAVSVEAAGFKIMRVQDVILEIGQTRTLDFKLDVGGVQEVVEVADSAPPLDRTSPVIGTVIQPAQLKNLPLNGRNWAGLMLLAPGAINTGEGNHLSTRFVGRARDDVARFVKNLKRYARAAGVGEVHLLHYITAVSRGAGPEIWEILRYDLSAFSF